MSVAQLRVIQHRGAESLRLQLLCQHRGKGFHLRMFMQAVGTRACHLRVPYVYQNVFSVCHAVAVFLSRGRESNPLSAAYETAEITVSPPRYGARRKS